jgi:tubulin beta
MLMNSTCMSLFSQNFALCRLATSKHLLTSPTLQDLNHLQASFLSTLTSSFRYRSQPTFSFHKMQTSLIPFPRLHFFTNNYLQSQSNPIDNRIDCLSRESFGEEMFDMSNCMVDVREDRGRTLTYYCGVRSGRESVSERFIHD